MLVAAVDEVDALDPAGALGGQGRDEVGEAAAQVGHDDVGTGQRRGPGDDRGVVEVALAEAALGAAQALAVDLDGGPHLAQGTGEAKAVLVDGLVDDGQALGLGERHDEGLLPVGHEAGVDVGLHHDRLQVTAGVVEADALIGDVEGAPHLAEGVEEGGHVALVGSTHEHVPASGQGGRGPGGGLDAVRQGRVGVAAQLVDALDVDGAVGVHRDDGAHLLQDVDQVHDLGLDGGIAQLGQSVRAHSGEQGLLGGSDRGVGKLDDGALETVRRGEPDALGLLVDRGAELAQDLQVEVDGAVTDTAPTQVGDEGLPQAVQERTAEEDRDARGAGVRVNVGHVGRLDLGRVQLEDALALVVVDAHSVQAQQPRDHVDVTNERDVAQH